jgi:hypothetical protein
VKSAIPLRCAPSAPPRATKSAWPSSRSAAFLSWTAWASALTRLIKVRSSASAIRSSTAATSPASKAKANWSKNVDGSATGGVIR